MEKEEKKRKIKWLWRYRNALFEAESLWRQADEWKYRVIEPSCKVLDGMPRNTSVSNNTTRDIVKHMEIIEDAKKATADAKEIRTEVQHQINLLDDGILIKILTLRYIEGMEWDDVRTSVGYSKPHTIYLHNEALEKLNTSNNHCESY